MSFLNFNWKAVGATLFPLAAGYTQGLIYRDYTKSWYDTLKTPDWKPPRIAFPIVWTSLYTGMGYASYLVWKEGGGFSGPARLPLMMYATQLAINFSWTPVFFGRGNLGGAFAIILLLDACVATTGYMFYQVCPTAGYIIVPYMAWLSLASCLNYWIWKNNPDVLKPSQAKITEVKDENEKK